MEGVGHMLTPNMIEMAPVMIAVRCPLAIEGSSARFGGGAGVGELLLLAGDAPLCSPDCCLVSSSLLSARQMSVRWVSCWRWL
jgi:hypothetical protein